MSVCGPALRLSLRVLHTHCYAANCFVLSFQHIKSVPHYPTHFVLQGVMCEFCARESLGFCLCVWEGDCLLSCLLFVLLNV